MKTRAKEIVRWAVIVASGGCGLWLLAEAARACFHVRWRGEWFDLFIFSTLFLFVLAATAPLSIAYICFRRQYRRLYLVLGVVGAVIVFGECMSLPDQLGIYRIAGHPPHENPVFAVLGLPLALLFLFGPAYAAAWFYRICHRLAYPGTGGRPKTRATGWLVWSGAGLMLLPVIMGAAGAVMLVANMHAGKTIPTESLFNWLSWVTGLIAIGSLVFFLGLMHRRPVAETEENPSDAGREC